MKKRIAYITDTHVGEQYTKEQNVNAEDNWKRVLADIQQEHITDIIIGGDIGETQVYQWLFDTIKNFSLHLTLGNHDHFADVIPFLPGKSVGERELYYGVTDEFYTYLFIDSSSDSISKEQIEWLTQRLQTDKTILLFIHHPVLPIDTPVDRIYPLENRERVQQCLSASGKQITLFCGHYHMEDERTVGNIHQIITPAASFQIQKFADEMAIDGSEFGYRIIELDKGSIATRVKMFKS